jgi:hypothetical protein
MRIFSSIRYIPVLRVTPWSERLCREQGSRSFRRKIVSVKTSLRLTRRLGSPHSLMLLFAWPQMTLARATFSPAQLSRRVRSGRSALPRTVGDPSRVSQEGKLELTDAPRSVETVAQRIPEGFRMADSERVTVKAWSDCHGFTPYLPFSTAASSAIPTSRQI